MTPLESLRAGGKPALARALARLESRPDAAETLALLDAAWAEQNGHALGITGPPGVGKSTLIDALIRAWRGRGRTVAVIAVDPSSRRSGGALLGDRTRFSIDPEDQGVFVRSMAARDRLGGLADLAFPALALMRATHDLVVVETVGVGQSETEIVDIADSVMFCAQPGSGDSLQFMKAGVMEIPDLAVVTKADMGAPARRALADLRGALSLAAGREAPAVLAVSATAGEGMDALVEALEARIAQGAAAPAARADRLARHIALWAENAIRAEFGARGAAASARDLTALSSDSNPFSRVAAARLRLERAFAVGISQH
ncbi:MAG: ArgK/MeaB family GTPase [Rubrimonas sp.]|uniref:ArgK/MeaB family GTPase n=1 Tax=Rubrimonas sp. TaxID=2036015 RepID=UPI002FDD22CE